MANPKKDSEASATEARPVTSPPAEKRAPPPAPPAEEPRPPLAKTKPPAAEEPAAPKAAAAPPSPPAPPAPPAKPTHATYKVWAHGTLQRDGQTYQPGETLTLPCAIGDNIVCLERV